MKRLAVFGFAAVAAVAAQAEKSVYEVSADGESGINLISLGDGYYQDRFSVANKTLCVTGAVTHAAIPEGSYLEMSGAGESTRLNMWETGLFSDNTLNTPIKLSGSGIFDFYEDTLTLGRDWAKWIAWDAGKAAILRLKNLTITDTSGDPLVFDPVGEIRVGNVKTGTGRSEVRLGQDGGRLTALFSNFFGSGGSTHESVHDNRYTSLFIGGATATSKEPGYADVSFLRTDEQSKSYMGIVYFSKNVLAAKSLQASQAMTNVLRLACGTIRILNMYRYGPESCLVRIERPGASITIPGYHGELFQKEGTGADDGRFVVETVNGATFKVAMSGQCTFGTSSRVEIRSEGNVSFGISGLTNAMDRIVASSFDWNTSGDLLLTGSNYTTVEGENSLPHGAGHGDVSIACNAFIKENQTVNSLVGGGTLWNYAADPVTITVGADGDDCRYNVISATADVKTVKITSTAETIHNAGWDLVKTGAGNLTLVQAFPRHLTVEDGNLVIAKPMTLAANSVTLHEGASIAVANGAEVAYGELMASLGDGYTHAISLVSGGTLTVGGNGADEEIDLANVAGDATAVIHKIGSNKVTLKNFDNFRGVIRKDAGTIVPSLVSALTWTGGAGADTSFETLANWGLSEPALLRGFTATFATGGDTATVNEAVPLAGLVFDQQAAGKSDFTVTGAGKVVLGATGIVTKEPPADGANAYTIAAPLELSESQTWWVTNGIGATPARQTSLRIAGPLSSVKSGITVTKKGWGDVWLCATNSTSTAAITCSASGTVHIAGNNAWGAAGAKLTANSGARVMFEGGEFDGDLTTSVGSANVTPKPIGSTPGSTNVFRGTVTFSGGTRFLFGKNSLLEFHQPFSCGGWTYGYGEDKNTTVLRFYETATFSSGEWNALTFDFRAPNNLLGTDFCLKYGGSGIKVLLNCEWAWDTTRVCQVWQDSLIDICGHNNKIGTFQQLSTSACVTNSGEKATFWIDAQKEGVTERDGGPQMPTTIRGHFRGPVTLGKTGPYDITVTNRAMTSSGDLVVAQGRLAFCNKSSWLNGQEVVVTNVVGGGNAVLEIRQAKALNRRATLRLGNGGKLRLGLAGVDAPFRQSVRELFIDGFEQEAGVYSAADANGRPTVAGTRPCANLEGPGTLYVRGIGAVLIVR